MNISSMVTRFLTLAAGAVLLSLSLASPISQAAPINFSGQLDVILEDVGGAIYSGVPLGTHFFGTIDDVTAFGAISDGTTPTAFGCCIAAGALEVVNDELLDADGAALLNFLIGSSIFSDGDFVDIIDLEGDTITGSGGRIEIGLSYLFDDATFTNDDLSNYPFDPDDLLLALFFIAEFDSTGAEIYSAVGVLDPITEPTAIAILGLGLAALSFSRRRRTI